MQEVVRLNGGSNFEQTFKNIDNVLWKEAGCTTELDDTEQSSWMLFLRYLDDLEHERALKAELAGKAYDFIVDKAHRWSTWAAPKNGDGAFDHDHALTGDDLIKFVDSDLFPYLHGFRQRASGPHTIEYKIGEIFGEIKRGCGNMRSLPAHLCWNFWVVPFSKFSADVSSDPHTRQRGL